MTFKERLQKEYPGKISERYWGGCSGCPMYYGYEKQKPDFCHADCKTCTRCWNREIQEEEKMFTLSDLKDTNIIETRNGNRYMVIKGSAIREESYLDLSTHKTDLTHPCSSNFDIMKVYESDNNWGFKTLLEKPGKLIWERKKPVKEITAEEACKLLKEKFPEYDSVKITV